METIKGAVDTASKVLFGDQSAKTGEQGQHVEPQSGVTGNTSAGEPYDGGNLDQRNPGAVAGQGYSQQDDAHAFQTSHEIPRGEGAIGSSHTHQGTGGFGSSHKGTGSGLTGGSSNAGPHDSNVANKLDPRIDSDRDARSGLTGSSNTGDGLMGSSTTNTGSGLTGGYGGSTNAGPHDSNILNKADPRVDSDRDGRSDLTGSSNTNTGSGLMGTSNTGNDQSQGGIGATLSKAAAAVTGGAVGGAAANQGQHGSGYDNNRGTTNVSGSSYGTQGYSGAGEIPVSQSEYARGNTSSNAGPHDSHILNKADPRVDSDRNGRSGLTGSSHTGTTGGGLMGSSGGYGSSNAGPHDSNVGNKLDSRVDSDRDGRSNLTGSSNTGSGLMGSNTGNTQSQGGVGATLSKAASAVTGGAVGGAAANQGQHGSGYDNNHRGTTGGNNNLGEYSMRDATEHATAGQHRQPGIADAAHRDDTHRHQGANDPLDQPGHHETHAIRDTKNEAERKLDPRNDSHGPGASSGVAGQNPHSVRQGSLTANLPGAPGGEGLKSTTGEGTGKQYVKSTGLAAEGGDFDASRPGAGKEADRLLDEHGINHGEKAHVGHGHEEASSKMAGGHTTTGTHSHGAHTGTPGTLGSHDNKHVDPETASTTAIRHGVPGQSTTHTSSTGSHTGGHSGAHSSAHTGAHDAATGSHTGTHGEGPLHADLKGVRHEKGHGHDGVYGTVAEGTTDEKPSLKDKIKAKIHMS